MGMSYSVHLGPYIKVRVRVEEREIDACRNLPECPNPSEGFCSKCGLEVSERYSTCKMSVVDLDELDDKYLHFLVSANSSEPETKECHRTYRFFGNQYYLERDEGWSKYDGEVEWDLIDVNPAAELKSFKKHYAEVLSYIQKQVGAENLTYHWGFLTHYG